jgi:hypothetical protein
MLCTTLLAFMLITGCGDGLRGFESEYTIKVTGSDKTAFSGHYSFPGPDKVPQPVQVTGATPAEYKGKGIAAACYFRKTDATGTLKVEIVKDGKIVASSETAAPYGIITLKQIPDQDSILNQILKNVLG